MRRPVETGRGAKVSCLLSYGDFLGLSRAHFLNHARNHLVPHETRGNVAYFFFRRVYEQRNANRRTPKCPLLSGVTEPRFLQSLIDSSISPLPKIPGGDRFSLGNSGIAEKILTSLTGLRAAVFPLRFVFC